jgi:hypothetical protein
MIDIRTLLLMDNNPADAKVCREALLTADDGAFEVNLLRHSLKAWSDSTRKEFGGSQRI